ncbi:MAG TPA: hypothetical protein VI669_02490 [Vicinamibacteria bacterium]
MIVFGLALLLLAAPGRPLHYWGARPAVVIAEVERGAGLAAQVEEVNVAFDKGALVFRLTFDRPLADVLHLKDGTPVSGRLSAAVYLDADDDRKTGLVQGPTDLRTGADYRLEIGVLALGADEDEKRLAQALVTATLYSLEGDRRRAVWRADDSALPPSVSAYGECLDVRLPAGAVSPKAGARVILASGPRAWDGRYKP